MLKPIGCLALLALLPLSCKSSQSPPADSEVKVSARTLIVPDSEIQGMPFNFCPEKRSFSLNNATWLTYFAVNQYSHFKEMGPALERLGFGDKGEGDAYLRKWWELRIKRVNEGRLDTDDQWRTPQDKVKLEKELAKTYRELFGKDYVDDGMTSITLQETLVSGKTPSAKIQFISGLSQESGVTEKTSTQVFYAEHNTMNLSIVSFRGTEGEEGPDRTADLKLFHTKFDGLGEVHQGMYEAYKEVDEPLLNALRMRSKDKPINLWVTGHSLGAALATIFTARVMLLQEKGDLANVRLVGTYHVGSPRLFDAAAAKAFDEKIVSKKINYVRIRNHKDLVTGLPTGVRGVADSYWHVGALAYFSENGNLSYGDGWEKIEKESDILKSFPTEIGDHDLMTYFKLIKKATASSSDAAAKSCAPQATEKPLLPFHENPAART